MELSRKSKSFKKKFFRSKNVIGQKEGVLAPVPFFALREQFCILFNRVKPLKEVPPCLTAVLWTGKLARSILVHARNVLQILRIRHPLETGLEKRRVKKKTSQWVF